MLHFYHFLAYIEPLEASGVSVIYTNVYGQLMSHQIPADESYAGKIILFPAKLSHTVYPFFTSDGYRISISGNLFRTTEG